ncbi:hypothetical protein N0V88_005815 [Collariella sp. IMI 366227]|nr:hypothetical protein N0V88_005815 [Collariella sp. IMI 366227]
MLNKLADDNVITCLYLDGRGTHAGAIALQVLKTNETRRINPLLKDRVVSSQITEDEPGEDDQDNVVYEWAYQEKVARFRSQVVADAEHMSLGALAFQSNGIDQCISNPCKTDPTPELVLEYIPLGSLQQQHRVQRFSLEETFEALRQTLVVHRDIKADNLVVQSRSPFHIKISDFDFSKETESYLETRCGAAPYLASEVVKRDRYDSAVDIWSLGVVVLRFAYRFPNYVFNKKREFDKPRWIKRVMRRLEVELPVLEALRVRFLNANASTAGAPASKPSTRRQARLCPERNPGPVYRKSCKADRIRRPDPRAPCVGAHRIAAEQHISRFQGPVFALGEEALNPPGRGARTPSANYEQYLGIEDRVLFLGDVIQDWHEAEARAGASQAAV